MRITKRFLAIGLILAALGTAAADSDRETYGDPEQVGTITDGAIPEVSGITPSRTAAGLWWVHNDSWNEARLYVIHSSGKVLGSFAVSGSKNRDWEDIAGGPGGDGLPALYIGDIGNNLLSIDHHVIYRVREPDLSGEIFSGRTEPAEAFFFRYPDGRHNAEALFVDPGSGRIYIVTHTRRAPCGVYRFPLPLCRGKEVVLEKMEGDPIQKISALRHVTGAAAAADGSRVVIRTYSVALEFRRAKGGDFESIFRADPLTIAMPNQRQGEAIAYSPDGKFLITTGEHLPAPIFKLVRHKP